MEIKPCVKCGGEAEHIKLFNSKRYDCFFRCKSCGRETAVYTSKQNAVEAWNSGKLTLTDKDVIELLEKRAWAGRMSVQDKQIMLEAASRIERLTDDKLELEAIIDLRSKRKWYTKFVKEVYQKQKGDELSYPDFDYIYEQYFKLAAEIERLKAMNDQILMYRRFKKRPNSDTWYEVIEKAKAAAVDKMEHTLLLEYSDCLDEETVSVCGLRENIKLIAKEVREDRDGSKL